MPTWIVIIIDVLICYFFFGEWLLDNALPRIPRARRRLRSVRASIKRALRRNCDCLPQSQCERMGEEISVLDGIIAEHTLTAEQLEEHYAHYEREVLPKLVPQLSFSTARSWLETLVVSVGVAFCIRSLLLQPFKIPTGSMQPTLYGIHYVAAPDEVNTAPNAFKRAFDYLNYSKRYVDMVAPDEIWVDCNVINPLPSKPLFPKSAIQYYSTVDGNYNNFVFPGMPMDAAKAIGARIATLNDLRSRLRRASNGDLQLKLHKGERLLHGAVESGDHLFVNRMSLAFHEPKRGDVMVFSTRGILYNGSKLAGDFYIKRLVGMPGDTLVIRDRALYVKPAGENEFHKLDAGDARGFARINSRKNGYNGYSAIPQALYRNGDDVEYTVPAGHYFMLGDNTDNSLDSRFWGSVPRENLIGLPCFVWWPFTTRFGTVD